MWGAEAELPPDAEAALQHSKRVGARLPLLQVGEGLWSAEAELPPDAEAALQHSKRVGARLPLPQTGEGGCGVQERSFRLMLKRSFSTPKGLATNAPTNAA